MNIRLMLECFMSCIWTMTECELTEEAFFSPDGLSSCNLSPSVNLRHATITAAANAVRDLMYLSAYFPCVVHALTNTQ